MKTVEQITLIAILFASRSVSAEDKFDATADAINFIKTMNVGQFDWPQWGGSPHRNNTPNGANIPIEWDLETGRNVLWAAPLGSQTFGNPIVANGKVFIGTNNTHGYVKRFPSTIDLGVLLAFDEKTGEFLWQASSPKLTTCRVNDWPMQGVCSNVFCDDHRLWYNTNRGEIVCLDVEGFYDGVDNRPFKDEPNENKDEADVIWRYDMIGELGVSPHNKSLCSVTCVGDRCFVITGNGVDEGFINMPSPDSPSFICLDKNSGKLLWTDNSPGRNVLHCQWSSPCVFEAGGREQVLMSGGDGWIYSFDPAGDGNGRARVFWKFDANPKAAKHILSGRGTRNHIVGMPVFYQGRVYVAVGDDPEHGEGVGHLYCVDPTKDGDVSLELAVDAKGKPIPHRRHQAVDVEKGERAIANPNSAAIWHYDNVDRNGNGVTDFDEIMHRTVSSPAIKDDLLVISDVAGLVHCMDAKKMMGGKPVVYWTHDVFATIWGSVMIVDGKIYVGDEDGELTIFELSKNKNVLAELQMDSSIYSTPTVANDTLFIATKNTLFAIKPGAMTGERSSR